MNLNILETVEYFPVDLKKLDKETIDLLKNELDSSFIDEKLELNDPLFLSLDTIHEFSIDSDAIDWDSGYFDEDELEEVLKTFLGNHYYYLVFAANCQWNGASGYKFCKDIKETVYRNYEITLIIEESGDDWIKCKEYSHDRPMGGVTTIIGISEEEYDKLNDCEFNEVENFVNHKTS